MAVLSLIAALEKATGPDHELDAAIADLVDLPIIENGQVVACPLFTSSIDAAMTLVKAGEDVNLYLTGKDGIACCEVGNGVLPDGDCRKASSMALALCIAALRARASKTEGRSS